MNREESWLLKEKYQGDASATGFRDDCIRLSQGEPLAYIIGYIPFLTTTIFLDAHPLIPRPETEFWTEKAIAEMRVRTPKRVLDLCAGSGCIGVAVLESLPNVCVDFVEIDTRLHPTIAKNIAYNTIEKSRTRIFGGSLFTEITGVYEFILSNPPYVDKSLGRVAPEVSSHEPLSALYGGVSGMEVITEIITTMSPFLAQTGILYIEHEPEHVAQIAHLSSQLGYTAHSCPDQYGIPRYTHITRITT